jgi:hypothetical protein
MIRHESLDFFRRPSAFACLTLYNFAAWASPPFFRKGTKPPQLIEEAAAWGKDALDWKTKGPDWTSVSAPLVTGSTAKLTACTAAISRYCKTAGAIAG